MPARGATEDEGRDHATHGKAGSEGRRLPVAEREAHAQARAAAATAVRASQVGLGPVRRDIDPPDRCLILRTIDEDQVLRLEIDLIVEPGLSSLQDVGTVLFARMARLFLRVIAWRRKNRWIVP